jgi:RNA ligase
MKLKDTTRKVIDMFKDELKEYIKSSNLVNMKEAGDGLYVLKYKKKVFYDNLWNDYIAECRGSIVDADFNLVTYPFTKIYNYGIEKEAPVLADDVKVTAYRKINGFMVAVTWYNGDILVSTTGSTDSDYVKMARELIEPNIDRYRMTCQVHEGYTFMFECVHKLDPHIIPEKEGMYLLGMRYNAFGSPIIHEVGAMFLQTAFHSLPVEVYYTTMGELKAMVKTVKHEGFVFYTEDRVSAKIKSPYYLTSKWVARNPRTDKLVDLNKDIKHNLDEEYYPLVDAIRANIVEYTAMDEQARLSWVRNYMEAL